MNKILTSVALCIAIAAAQQIDNNATDTSASVSAVASSTPASSNAASGSTSGPVILVPVSQSSEAALDTPTSSPATTSEAPVSTKALQQSVASSAATSDDMTLTSPATETSAAALATPSSSESPSYTFAPTTTADAPASSSADYTYAPTTTDNTTPVAPIPATESSEDSLSTPTNVADTTDSATLRVAQTETPQRQLDTPTASSPNDTPAATTSAEYNFAPTTSANEAASSSPEFSFAPTTGDNTAAASAKETSQEFTYAPSSEESSAPTIVPVLVPSGSSASFAIGTNTIGLGETATVGSESLIVKTNSKGNTEVQFGATGTPSLMAYSSGVELPASFTDHAADHAASEQTSLPSVTQNSKGDYVVGSQTLAPGSAITQGSGKATQVIALSTNSEGSTQLYIADSSTTGTQPIPIGTAAPSTLETQVLPHSSPEAATLNGHSVAIESPAFTAHTEPAVLTLNGHTLTATPSPPLPSSVHVLNGHTFSESPSPTLPSNEIELNGKTLTVSPVLKSTSVIDHVITFQGHPISVGAATLAAEPTGVTGVDSAPSSTGKLQGAASRVGAQSWLWASLGVVFGAVALVM